jgi:hypothetical protein
MTTASRDDHRHLLSNKVISERRKTIKLTVRPAILDLNVLAFDKPDVIQALTERSYKMGESSGCLPIQEPNHRHGWLLRARRERPCRCGGYERDERAAFHCTAPLGVSNQKG